MSPRALRRDELPKAVRDRLPPDAPVTRVKRGSPEHDAQAAFFGWLRVIESHPTTPDRVRRAAALTYAVPNGGQRDRRVAARLQAEGVKRGVPDLNADIPVTAMLDATGRGAGPYHGWRCELKIKPNRLTAEQAARLGWLADAGYRAECITGADAADAARQLAAAWARYVGYDVPPLLRLP